MSDLMHNIVISVRQFYIHVLGIFLVGALCAGCTAGSENPSSSDDGSNRSNASRERCPVFLYSGKPTLETPEGDFILKEAEVWIGPNCEYEYYDEKGVMVYYQWTNTTDEPIMMGAATGPLHPYITASRENEEFLAPPTLQESNSYKSVAPGESVDFEEWHSCVKCDTLPDTLTVYKDDGTEYGDIALSE